MITFKPGYRFEADKWSPGGEKISSPEKLAAIRQVFEVESNRQFAHSPMKLLRSFCFILLTMAAAAADNPYDETADAKLEIRQALTQAATNHIPVVVVFGANWCGDCKMLDTAMKTGASAPLLARDFKIVKVNVGRFDKNLEIAKAYGVPLTNGIPAVAIVSPKNEVLYATRQGELANARKLGDRGIYEFFKRVTAAAKAKE